MRAGHSAAARAPRPARRGSPRARPPGRPTPACEAAPAASTPWPSWRPSRACDRGRAGGRAKAHPPGAAPPCPGSPPRHLKRQGGQGPGWSSVGAQRQATHGSREAGRDRATRGFCVQAMAIKEQPKYAKRAVPLARRGRQGWCLPKTAGKKSFRNGASTEQPTILPTSVAEAVRRTAAGGSEWRDSTCQRQCSCVHTSGMLLGVSFSVSIAMLVFGRLQGTRGRRGGAGHLFDAGAGILLLLPTSPGS